MNWNDLQEAIKLSECDKAKIVGYIEQTPEQIKTINDLKAMEIQVVKCLDSFIYAPLQLPADPRWMSIAKTHIQQGFMAAVRAIARPKGD